MKIRDIIVEADPAELGPMNNKMKSVLDKVHAGDKVQAKADAEAKAKADAEKAAKQQAEDDKIIAFAKKHDFDLEPEEIIDFKRGLEHGKRGYPIDRGAGEAYGPYYAAYAKGVNIGEKMKEELGEASAGAMTASMVANVEAPHFSPGSARGKKSYLGKPGSHGGTKAPPQPKVKQPKKKDGTAVNALDMGTSLFGKGAVKR